MTKIKNTNAYPFDVNITDDDYVIGSDGDTQEKQTKNFPIGLVRDFILSGLSPLEGGTLRIVEFVDESVSGYDTPEDFLNDSSPVKNIEQYHIAITTLKNGEKYLLKKQDVVVGQGQTPLLSTDFIAVNLVGENLSEDISTYKGYNSTTGREEHYSLSSVGLTIQKEIVSGNETGNILIEQTEQTNLGTGVSVYKGFNTTTKKQEFHRISSNTAIVSLIGETLFIEFPNNNNINITAGANVTVSEPTPNNFVISSTDNIALLENSATTTITGDGTLGNEYQVDVNNLQKVVNTFPYTLLNSDDKYTIFLENGVANVVINVPDTLVDNFSVAFVQKGTGDVTITPTGTSVINSALGYKIKGQYYWALLEKELSTITYYLIGNTKL